MNAKYLELWKLNKTFTTPAGPFVAVQDFDLNLAEGEFVALIGHSGCGKSTLLNMVAGLLSDRIVMMTNGPAATIGDVVEVGLARPRERLALVKDQRYH